MHQTVAMVCILTVGLMGQIGPPLVPTESPFAVASLQVSPTLAFWTGHTMGDFDGDGEPDMVCGDGVAAWWQQNLGGGQLGPYQLVASVVAAGFSFNGLSADFDGDGLLDLVVMLNAGTPPQLPYLLLRRLSQPSGFALPIPLIPPSAAAAVSCGCSQPFFPVQFAFLQGGSVPDVVLTSPVGPGYPIQVVRFNSATLAFDWIATHVMAPDALHFGVLGSKLPIDLNRDGVNDLVIVKNTVSGSSLPQEVIPLLGVPPAAPGLPQTFVEGPRLAVPTGLGQGEFSRLHDINKDGAPDIVVAGVQVLYGDGAGGFLPPQLIVTGGATQPLVASLSVQFEDFNLDGSEDMLMVSASQGTAQGPGYLVSVVLFPGTPQPGVVASPQVLSVVGATCTNGFPGCGNGPGYRTARGRFDLDSDGDLDFGYWALAHNGAPERYGLIRNETVVAPGCSFSGPVPAIDVGPTLSGYPGQVTLRRGTPGGIAHLFVSTGTIAFAGCGGFIPDPSNLLPAGGPMFVAPVSDAGTVHAPYVLPPSATPFNQSLYLQWVVADPLNPLAVRLSALRKVVLW